MRRFIFFVTFLCLSMATQAQRFERVLSNISELIASNPGNADTNINVLGYYSAGDGGGGPYVWVKNDTSPTNYGSAFSGTYPGATGRFIDPYRTNVLNVRRFGARGNDSSDDTANIQSAINVGPNVHLTFPKGRFQTTGLVVTNIGVTFRGDGFESVLIRRSDTTNITLNVSAQQFQMMNMRMEGGLNTASPSDLLRVDNVSDTLISKVWFFGGYRQLSLVHGSSHRVEFCTFEECRNDGVYSYQSSLDQFIGNNFFVTGRDDDDPENVVASILFENDPAFTFPSYGNLVANNLFRKGGYSHGINSRGGRDLTIVGNVFNLSGTFNSGRRDDIKLSASTNITITANVSTSLNNDYVPGDRATRYDVNISDALCKGVRIFANKFEPGTLGILNDQATDTEYHVENAFLETPTATFRTNILAQKIWLSGGGNGDITDPAVRINSNKLITFLEAGGTNAALRGGIWKMTNEWISFFNGNNFPNGLTVDTNGNVMVRAPAPLGALTVGGTGVFGTNGIVQFADTPTEGFWSQNNANWVFFNPAVAGGRVAFITPSGEITLNGGMAVSNIVNTSLLYLNSNNRLAKLNYGANMTFTNGVIDSIPGGGGATNAIVSINNQTNQAQFLVMATGGTSPSIGSTNGTHTFNLPFATTTQDGILDHTNFVVFNTKAPAFTTAVWLTNLANVLSGNISPGTNMVFTTNANGNVTISSTANGSGVATNYSFNSGQFTLISGTNVNLSNPVTLTNISNKGWYRSGVINVTGTSATYSFNGPGTMNITPTGNFTLTIADAQTTGAQLGQIHYNNDGTNTLTLAGQTLSLKRGTLLNPPLAGDTILMMEQNETNLWLYVDQIFLGTELPIDPGTGVTFTTNSTTKRITIASSAAGGLINPTDGVIPYRSNATTFADSLIKQEIGTPYKISMSYRAADQSGPNFVLQKQGRTGSSTNTPSSGSELGVYGFGGWNGTTDVYSRGLTAITTENWTSSALGNELRFYNVPNGSTTSALRLSIAQDGKINVPGLASNSYLGTDGSSNLVVTNAPATSTGAWVTNVGGVLSGNIAAGSNITFTTNANGNVTIDSSGGGGSTNLATLLAFQVVGSGTDYAYPSGAYHKISFGTTGPGFVLTNSGQYQIMMTVAAYDNGSAAQDFYVTNITDGVIVSGSQKGMNVSSWTNSVPINFQVTTSGANKTFELWGQTQNGTYTSVGVMAKGTVSDVILLSSGSVLSGNAPTNTVVSGSFPSTLNGIAKFSDTTGTNLVSSTATISANRALTLPGATLTVSEPIINGSQTWNASGVTMVGYKMRITDTASAAASLALDVGVSGALMTLRKDGLLTVPSMQIGGPSSTLSTLAPVASFGGPNLVTVAIENNNASGAGTGAFFGAYENDSAALASGDRLGGIVLGGSSSASALRDGARISALATQNWTNSSAYGTRLSFALVPNGGTALAVVGGFEQDGRLTFSDRTVTGASLKQTGTTLAVLNGDGTSDGNATVGAFTSSGAIAMQGTISPPQITADQDDYNPAGLATAYSIRLSTDAPRTITGLQTDGVDGRTRSLFNAGSFTITFVDDSSSSATTNRFFGPGAASFTLVSREGVMVRWSSTDSHWRTLSKEPSSAGSGITALTGDVIASGTGSVSSILATNLQISTPTILGKLTITNGFLDSYNQGDARVFSTAYGTNVSGGIVGQRARGTQASPLPVLADDTISDLAARGYNGSIFSTNSKALISMKAAYPWNSISNSTYISFYTTPRNVTTVAERLRLDDQGYVFNYSTPGTGGGFFSQIVGDTGYKMRVGVDATDSPTLEFGSGTGARDVFITRDGPDILAMRDGTTAQTLRVYNTWTDASNGEWATENWSDTANTLTFGTKKNGSGSTRGINLVIGGTTRASFNTSGDFLVGTTNIVGAIAGKVPNTLAGVTNALGLTGDTTTFLRSDGTQTVPAGGGSGTVGTMINTTTPVLYDLYRAKDTTTTNVEPSTIVANGSSLKLGHDAASPVAQTIIASGPRGGTDTNIAGVNLGINGSPGTGTGSGGSINFGTSPSGSNGTATNATVTAMSIASTGVTTFTFQISDSYTSVASTPAETLTGTWFTGGSATTTKPHFLIEPTGTTSTGWITAGTGLGINANGGTPNLIDAQLSGVTKFNVSSAGIVTAASSFISGSNFKAPDAGFFYWANRSIIGSSSDGKVELQNNAQTSFTSLELGIDSANPPTTVTLRAANGVGTDKVSGGLTLATGTTTGSGVPNSIDIKTSIKGTVSSSTVQVLKTRVHISGVITTLTESSATKHTTITLASGKSGSYFVKCQTRADDGTDFQTRTDTLQIDAVNKAGTVTVAVSVVASSAQTSTGTLTTTWTAAANGNNVDIFDNAVSSLTQTTLVCSTMSFCDANDATSFTDL